MAGRHARTARPPHAGRGQHFLRSRALAASLVDDAGVEPGELVLDLGAGHGILAAELAKRGARVWAVESDPALVTGLRARFAGPTRVTVVERDARRLGLPHRSFAVVANLPFAGGSAILRRLLDDPRVLLTHADVVVQWEVAAKRAAVWPSTMLGVFWGAWYDVTLVRRLPACVFAPPPSVDAAVLRIVRRDRPLVPVRDAAEYEQLLRRTFAAGRPIRALLPARLVKRLALELGFAPDAVARDLDARQWAALYGAVRDLG